MGFDLIEVELSDGEKVSGLNIVDIHTGFQVVWAIRKPSAQVKSMDLLVAFEMAWGHWAQYPESVKCDAGTHFQGIFAGFFQALGVPIANTGTEAQWQNGLIEVSGRAWQRAFEKTVTERQLTSKDFLQFLVLQKNFNVQQILGTSKIN